MGSKVIWSFLRNRPFLFSPPIIQKVRVLVRRVWLLWKCCLIFWIRTQRSQPVVQGPLSSRKCNQQKDRVKLPGPPTLACDGVTSALESSNPHLLQGCWVPSCPGGPLGLAGHFDLIMFAFGGGMVQNGTVSDSFRILVAVT
jgi:hypothetical protein